MRRGALVHALTPCLPPQSAVSPLFRRLSSLHPLGALEGAPALRRKAFAHIPDQAAAPPRRVSFCQ